MMDAFVQYSMSYPSKMKRDIIMENLFLLENVHAIDELTTRIKQNWGQPSTP